MTNPPNPDDSNNVRGNSEVSLDGNTGKEDLSSSQTTTSEFSNNEQRIFQMENQMQDLKQRMDFLLNHILEQLSTYKILKEEESLLNIRLQKAKRVDVNV